MIKPMFVPLYDPYNEVDLSRIEIEKIALIDADRYKYIVAHNMYYEINNNGEKWSEELLKRTIDSCLSRYVFNRYKAIAYVFCFSGGSKTTFRYHLANIKEYKGQRKKRDDPYYYEQKAEDMVNVLKYIQSNQITFVRSDLEADDIISMLQNEHTFVHSIDKDLKQIPGDHYVEDDHKIITVSEEDAFKLIMHQCILGDTTDNIPGIKGCGPKFVESLEKFEDRDLFTAVTNEFISRYGLLNGVDAFVEMYNLVSMKKQRGEWNRERFSLFYNRIDELIKTHIKNGTEKINDKN